jgi:hypothetical protein
MSKMVTKMGHKVRDNITREIKGGLKAKIKTMVSCLGCLALEGRRDDSNDQLRARSELMPPTNKSTLIIKFAETAVGASSKGIGISWWGQGWTWGNCARLSGNMQADTRIKTKEGEACHHVSDWFTHKFSVIRVDKVGHAVTSDDLSECFSQLLNKDEAERHALCEATLCNDVKMEIKEGELEDCNNTNRTPKKGGPKVRNNLKVALRWGSQSPQP